MIAAVISEDLHHAVDASGLLEAPSEAIIGTSCAVTEIREATQNDRLVSINYMSATDAFSEPTIWPVRRIQPVLRAVVALLIPRAFHLERLPRFGTISTASSHCASRKGKQLSSVLSRVRSLQPSGRAICLLPACRQARGPVKDDAIQPRRSPRMACKNGRAQPSEGLASCHLSTVRTFLRHHYRRRGLTEPPLRVKFYTKSRFSTSPV